MKSIIPFTKELDFDTKVSEITSISLEREFEVSKTSITGNLFVTGDYKSHEISANVIPFSFKIPFTIEIPENLKEDSITLEISDFAYDMEDNNKIKVNIELELDSEEIEIVEEEVIVEVDTDELIRMMEEKSSEDVENTKEKIVEEIIDIVEIPQERHEDMKESENLIIQNINTSEEEYTTYHIHIVKEGESIDSICTLYNSNLSMLGEYNNLSEVTPGCKIIIPNNYES